MLYWMFLLCQSHFVWIERNKGYNMNYSYQIRDVLSPLSMPKFCKYMHILWLDSGEIILNFLWHIYFKLKIYLENLR